MHPLRIALVSSLITLLQHLLRHQDNLTNLGSQKVGITSLQWQTTICLHCSNATSPAKNYQATWHTSAARIRNPNSLIPIFLYGAASGNRGKCCILLGSGGAGFGEAHLFDGWAAFSCGDGDYVPVLIL